ncbi:unnamed protein product [Brassicogethes aeneus]|uniref:Uncharacterized protein n=1 Tax=Brassicogethes aeneus TaxID=1431903 RepID=A0A9P0FBL2_BRAAE|nr:unnamed protein product [Brassicogethes aeneus]
MHLNESVFRLLKFTPSSCNTWHDLRARTKIKEAKQRNYERGTGGGPPKDKTFDNVEKIVLNVIKTVSIEGHAVPESRVEFDFQDPEIEGETVIVEQVDNGLAPMMFMVKVADPHHAEQPQVIMVGANDAEDKNESNAAQDTEVEKAPKIDVKSMATTANPTPPRKLQQETTTARLAGARSKGYLQNLSSVTNSASAAAAYQSNLEDKLKMKSKYYDEKLCNKIIVQKNIYKKNKQVLQRSGN